MNLSIWLQQFSLGTDVTQERGVVLLVLLFTMSPMQPVMSGIQACMEIMVRIALKAKMLKQKDEFSFFPGLVRSQEKNEILGLYREVHQLGFG